VRGTDFLFGFGGLVGEDWGLRGTVGKRDDQGF
jgi:hypothetical protein